MNYAALLLVAIAAFASVDAYVPQVKKSAKPASKPAFDLKHAAATAFTAATLASNVFGGAIAADAIDTPFSSSTILSEKVVREGMYGDYEVDLTQEYDDASSKFKSAKETKSKKGKYTAILGILVVGSFIIPMAQYFWYVRDDDSSDKFFEPEKIPDPEPPKKKGWFN